MPNLREYLSRLDIDKAPHFLGRSLILADHSTYYSGGGGMLFNRAALRTLKSAVEKDPNVYGEDMSVDDVAIGKLMAKVRGEKLCVCVCVCFFVCCVYSVYFIYLFMYVFVWLEGVFWCLFICLFVCLFVCFICLFVVLFVYLSVCLFVCLFVCFGLFICTLVCSFVSFCLFASQKFGEGKQLYCMH